MDRSTHWINNKNKICLRFKEFRFQVTIMFMALKHISQSYDEFAIVLITIFNGFHPQFAP